GCPVLEELTIEALMPLPPAGGTAIQVAVGAADGTGRRPVSVYSRVEDAPAQVEWTRHASGVLAEAPPGGPLPGSAGAWLPAGAGRVHRPAAEAAPGGPLPAGAGAWPPAGAEPVDISDVYDYLTSQGYHYGPMFRGLRAVWRRGTEVFAEVALPDGAQQEAARFGLHPSLLDAALSATDFLGGRKPQDIGASQLPFAWTGVRLHNRGADRLRVRVNSVGSGA